MSQNIRWYDATALTVEGRGWTAVSKPFDRLPARAEGLVRQEVWDLSRNSAGISILFKTDATKITARWTVASDHHFPHMTDAALKGLDLYRYSEQDRQWSWVGSGFNWNGKNPYQADLVTDLDGRDCLYRLYLPLYDGVDSLQIGVPQQARFRAGRFVYAIEKPLVFYGTSITQGGCASRPGMAYPALIGRHLAAETINLGFSGNGKMDPELAGLLSEIDAAVYVIDCLPNMDVTLIEQRAAVFIKRLNEQRPGVPLILINHVRYANIWARPLSARGVDNMNQTLEKVYRNLMAEGLQDIYLIDATTFLGDDNEATVDGVHFTDTGFLRFSDGLEPELIKILRRKLR